MEYIDREKALEIAKDEYYSDFHKSMADLTSLRELLEDTPAADVVEVRHAHWRKIKRGYWCSNCCLVEKDLKQEYNYCPNCGAKMDGKDGV